MDEAREFYAAGRLSEAIADLKQTVKSTPTDAGQRSFLFGLLCFAGEYEGAVKQLDVIALQSAQSEAGVQVYRNVLEAEKKRLHVFEGEQAPEFLLPPPSFVPKNLAAVKALQENNVTEAKVLLNQVSEACQRQKGDVDGHAFSQFADCHDLIAPILELIIHDKYFWLPFEQIKQMEIEKPARLQDLLWISTKLELVDGQVLGGYIPTRYALSHEHDNELVQLGRMTDWQVVAEEICIVHGQRMFFMPDESESLEPGWKPGLRSRRMSLSDESERPLLETRSVTFEREG
ncbi:MAG: type VI secretion system accessory protein TagJ [bacterium]